MRNQPSFDWNDLRYLLAIAREGSTLAAGRALRVSQTTVARRIAALGLPTVVVMEGGYAVEALGANVAGFLSGF